jgi:pantetheine-phosphate adenylyltransferase
VQVNRRDAGRSPAIGNGERRRLAFIMVQNLVIYPGSFDPITNGHLDLIERGRRLFDRLEVAILTNIEKDPLFTIQERVEMLREVTGGMPNVSVDTFSGLLVDYAKRKKAKAILRGIRAFSDYEYELQMALMNRKLEPTVETVFLMPAESYTYVSSRLVKEVLLLGGSVKNLVPAAVERRLQQKIGAQCAANG